MAASTIPAGAIPDIVKLAFGTAASGTGTVAAGATTAVITHGLGAAPALDDITVTPNSSWGSATKFWVSTPTLTQFTVTVDQAPGGSGMAFAWRARTPIV